MHDSLPFRNRSTRIMGSHSRSVSTGVVTWISSVLGTAYVWGSISVALYILVANVYVPYIRFSTHQLFNLTTTISLTSLHAVLVLMTIWSYFQVLLKDPGNLPLPHKLTKKEIAALEEGGLSILPPSRIEILSKEFYTCEPDGSPKYCQICQIYCPTRTSHCRETDRCVVKFDHYCPMLSSAIGVGNYKYFINFVFWTLLLTIYLQVTGFLCLFTVQVNGWFIFLVTMASIMAGFGILPLFIGQMFYIMNGVTTTEVLLDPALLRKTSKPKGPQILVCCNVRDFSRIYNICPTVADSNCAAIVPLDFGTNPFKISYWRNWADVMGIYPWEWLLPVAPTRSSNCISQWWEFEFNDATKETLRWTVREKLIFPSSSPQILGLTLDELTGQPPALEPVRRNFDLV
jgi:DHHC palmitoyltransferase